MNIFETFLYISHRVSVINLDTEFHKNWAFLCTTSPIFPFFIMLEGFGEFGEGVTKFRQIIDNECICYANM